MLLVKLVILQAHWLGGVSLLADFAFQTAASNLGQWAEVMIPIFCTLASEPWQALTGHSNVTAIVIPAFDRTDLQVQTTPSLLNSLTKSLHENGFNCSCMYT